MRLSRKGIKKLLWFLPVLLIAFQGTRSNFYHQPSLAFRWWRHSLSTIEVSGLWILDSQKIFQVLSTRSLRRLWKPGAKHSADMADAYFNPGEGFDRAGGQGAHLSV